MRKLLNTVEDLLDDILFSKFVEVYIFDLRYSLITIALGVIGLNIVFYFKLEDRNILYFVALNIFFVLYCLEAGFKKLFPNFQAYKHSAVESLGHGVISLLLVNVLLLVFFKYYWPFFITLVSFFVGILPLLVRSSKEEEEKNS